MNTLINELKNGALVLVLVILMSLVVVTAGAAVGTFTFRTSGASDTVEAVDLVYPQRVPESDSVTTESIADGSVTPAKISSGYNLLSDAEKTQALVGSSSVDLVGKVITAFEAIKSATGTVALPTYSFSSDPNTGIFSPQADVFGIVAGGATAGRFSVNQHLMAASGTVEFGSLRVAESSLSNGGTLTTLVKVTPYGTSGFFHVYSGSEPLNASVSILGTTLTLLAGSSANVSTTKDTANKLNIYSEGNYLTIQNKRGTTISLYGLYSGIWSR